MKTYREDKQPLRIFFGNWRDRLAGCVKDRSKLSLMTLHSKRWITCACGNADSRIERSKSGAPVDPYLHAQGIAFMDQVYELQFYRNDMGESFSERVNVALATLDKIDKRESELLILMEGL